MVGGQAGKHGMILENWNQNLLLCLYCLYSVQIGDHQLHTFRAALRTTNIGIVILKLISSVFIVPTKVPGATQVFSKSTNSVWFQIINSNTKQSSSSIPIHNEPQAIWIFSEELVRPKDLTISYVSKPVVFKVWGIIGPEKKKRGK